MPIPNVPEKLDRPSVTSPAATLEYVGKGDLDAPPATVLLCYQNAAFAHAVEAYDGRELPHGGPPYTVYELRDTDGAVGVVGDFGVGAPITAIVLEALIAHGVERAVVVGHVGSLQPDLGVGDAIVADGAVRDEGTSYHYVPADEPVGATPAVRDALAAVVRDVDGAVRVGDTWTTDALYRETAVEIERYRERGVCCVEMEAAAVFAVARYRGIDAGALFTVSDRLTPEGWDQRFDDTGDHLARLVDRTVEALA